jgi:hypothetical protein
MPTLVVPRVVAGLTLLVASLAWIAVARAQESPDVAAPAHIAYLEGSVTLERDGALESASVNMPIIAGDRLRTSLGRTELLFPDGSALDLDENSSIDVLSPTLVRLVAGRAMLIVAGAGDPSAAVRYQIDTPVASVRTDGPGEFRVAVLASRDGETELAVVRGFASLATERGEIAVRAGQRTVAFENGTPSLPQTFNSARFDAFDRWVAGRRDERMAASSAQYLPRELQTYGGTLDRYGSWQNTAPYGNVWYPTVDATWRPYYYGDWSPVGSYGWTWIGADVWSWPTHHYGRWGHTGARWFWIPGRTWAPAWVSWAAAPGYVSWCPLGYDGRPVFALTVGRGNPWAGWTVVSRGSFGFRHDRVSRYAIQPHLLPRTTPFIVQSVAPVAAPRYAGGRPAAGRRNATDNQPGDFGRRSGNADRSAGVGDRAVPRSSSGDQRPPSTVGRPATRDDRVFSPGRRQDADSPAATRDFRQPLPDAGRSRAVDRGTPAASRPTRVDEPAAPGADPRGPGRDPRLFSTGDLPSGAGRRPRVDAVTPPRANGIGRPDAAGRPANDDRRTTRDAARAPEAAAPRYPGPGVERRPETPPPPSGTFQRPGPGYRAPSAAPESRRPTANPRGEPAGAPPPGRAERPAPPAGGPPPGRVERSAPGGGESHGGRAVPRGEGSPRGGRQR